MGLNAKDLKAINWYTKEHSLKLRLSTPPTMYFSNKDGKEVAEQLPVILSEYKSWNEEDKRVRASVRKTEANSGRTIK